MSTYSIYFSPTKGTERIVDILTKDVKIDCKIDLSQRDSKEHQFTNDDICYIAVPSYGGRVPSIAIDRLRKMKADHTKAILVVAYGNRAYEDTLLELKNEVVSIGFHPIVAIAANAEHSIMRQFGHGRPDTQDEQDLTQFASSVHTLLSQHTCTMVEVPGNEPYREYNGIGMKPKANKQCTLCGLCAKLCPVGAILIEHPNDIDENTCISCMRCISVCPNQARGLNPLILKAASIKMKKVFAQRKTNELFLSEN